MKVMTSGETESREHNREVQETKTQVVWSRKETRSRIRGRKTLEMVPTGEEKAKDRSRDGWTV